MKRERKEFRKCLVVDSSYMPRQIIDSARAYVIFSKGNAEILADHPESFKLVDPNKVIYRPSIIRVPKYINLNIMKVPFSRENVFKRDNYTCVYCEEDDPRAMTIDHVIPKSKGGEDSFENCVTACKPCNWEKDDLTIEEWGKPAPNAYRPHYLMMIKGMDYIPQEWVKFMML